jgi:stage II sporulation protein AA (anti-sigma F factor antagonist)
MDIQVESRGAVGIIRIKGKVTFECCPDLQRCLDPIPGGEVRQVIIDFKEVPFIDSSGIGEVLRLFKRMRETGREVVLANPNQKLRDLFLMYRFNQFMKIQDNADLDAHK